MITFKYTTDALRKLRFSANFCGHKTQEGSRWLQATFSVLVARCVCCLPDREFTLSLPGQSEVVGSELRGRPCAPAQRSTLTTQPRS